MLPKSGKSVGCHTALQKANLCDLTSRRPKPMNAARRLCFCNFVSFFVQGDRLRLSAGQDEFARQRDRLSRYHRFSVSLPCCLERDRLKLSARQGESMRQRDRLYLLFAISSEVN